MLFSVSVIFYMSNSLCTATTAAPTLHHLVFVSSSVRLLASALIIMPQFWRVPLAEQFLSNSPSSHLNHLLHRSASLFFSILHCFGRFLTVFSVDICLGKPTYSWFLTASLLLPIRFASESKIPTLTGFPLNIAWIFIFCGGDYLKPCSDRENWNTQLEVLLEWYKCTIPKKIQLKKESDPTLCNTTQELDILITKSFNDKNHDYWINMVGIVYMLI